MVQVCAGASTDVYRIPFCTGTAGVMDDAVCIASGLQDSSCAVCTVYDNHRKTGICVKLPQHAAQYCPPGTETVLNPTCL